jgi:hypothetical protein
MDRDLLLYVVSTGRIDERRDSIDPEVIKMIEKSIRKEHAKYFGKADKETRLKAKDLLLQGVFAKLAPKFKSPELGKSIMDYGLGDVIGAVNGLSFFRENDTDRMCLFVEEIVNMMRQLTQELPDYEESIRITVNHYLKEIMSRCRISKEYCISNFPEFMEHYKEDTKKANRATELRVMLHEMFYGPDVLQLSPEIRNQMNGLLSSHRHLRPGLGIVDEEEYRTYFALDGYRDTSPAAMEQMRNRENYGIWMMINTDPRLTAKDIEMLTEYHEYLIGGEYLPEVPEEERYSQLNRIRSYKYRGQSSNPEQVISFREDDDQEDDEGHYPEDANEDEFYNDDD